MNSAQLLPAIRDLYSRRPEYVHHEPWELAHVRCGRCGRPLWCVLRVVYEDAEGNDAA